MNLTIPVPCIFQYLVDMIWGDNKDEDYDYQGSRTFAEVVYGIAGSKNKSTEVALKLVPRLLSIETSLELRDVGVHNSFIRAACLSGGGGPNP
jgi:hypothetical protein